MFLIVILASLGAYLINLRLYQEAAGYAGYIGHTSLRCRTIGYRMGRLQFTPE